MHGKGSAIQGLGGSGGRALHLVGSVSAGGMEVRWESSVQDLALK